MFDNNRCWSWLILDIIILFIHQVTTALYKCCIIIIIIIIYYRLVQRLGRVFCVLCFRCLTDNVALQLSKFY